MITVFFYNFIVLSSTILIFIGNKCKRNEERAFFIFIAFLIVFLPSALRYGVGANFYSYLNIYQNLDNYRWMEKGFYFVNWSLKSINANPQWSFITFSYIFTFAAFKSYPKKGGWIIHLTFFLTFYLLSFFYIRQAIAVAFCLWALAKFIEGERVKFLALVFIASLFHQASILIAIIGLASVIPVKNKVKYYIFPLLSLLLVYISMFKLPLVFSLIENILQLFGFVKYSGYFLSEKWMETRSLGTGLGVLSKVLFSLYFIFSAKYVLSQNKNHWLVIVLVLLYCLSTIISAQVVIFGRAAYMFIFSIPFAVYILWSLPKNKKINLFVCICFLMVSFMSLTRDGMDLGGQWGESLLLNPYKSVFTE